MVINKEGFLAKTAKFGGWEPWRKSEQNACSFGKFLLKGFLGGIAIFILGSLATAFILHILVESALGLVYMLFYGTSILSAAAQVGLILSLCAIIAIVVISLNEKVRLLSSNVNDVVKESVIVQVTKAYLGKYCFKVEVK